MRTLLVILLLCFSVSGYALPSTENQTVTIQSNAVAVGVTSTSRRELLVLNDIVNADIISDKVTFVVNKKNFNPKKIIVVQKSLFSKEIERLQFKVTPLSEKDHHKVTVNLSDKALPLVVFRLGSFLSGADYYVAVDDLQRVGVREVQSNERLPERNQLKHVEQLLASYPKNDYLIRKQLTLSLVVDKLDAAARQRKQSYADQKAFKAALAAEKNTKDRYQWKLAYEQYLERYPNGKYAKQARENLRRIRFSLQANENNPQSANSRAQSVFTLFKMG